MIRTEQVTKKSEKKLDNKSTPAVPKGMVSITSMKGQQVIGFATRTLVCEFQKEEFISEAESKHRNFKARIKDFKVKR